MNKMPGLMILLGLILAIPFIFPACMKDNTTRTYQIRTPIYQALSQFRESIKSEPALPVTFAGKIAVLGKYIFLSEPYKGIHIIDNTNPSSPKNISFINIPGNVDMAIKGHTMYADSYGDMVTFDIADPVNVIAKNFATNVFPERSIYYITNPYDSGVVYNPDSIQVIVGWTTRDTTVDVASPGTAYPMYNDGCPNCSGIAVNLSMTAQNAAAAAAPGIATNGSTARFSIINNFLYTVGYSNLTTFDISESYVPKFTSMITVGWQVETIYPFNDKLFIGTNNGMLMYDVQSNPSTPSLLGEFSHVRSCDPVIYDGEYAYVTLHDGTKCQGFANQLEVVDVTNMNSPVNVKTYPLTHPIGLSKDGIYLFICDGQDGLKVFDAADVRNLKLVSQKKDTEPVDVIAVNGIAIVVAADGIYEYDYSDISNIQLISKL